MLYISPDRPPSAWTHPARGQGRLHSALISTRDINGFNRKTGHGPCHSFICDTGAIKLQFLQQYFTLSLLLKILILGQLKYQNFKHCSISVKSWLKVPTDVLFYLHYVFLKMRLIRAARGRKRR